MRRFSGKIALVTGGRSGIGRAIARRLASEGARVFTAQRGADAEFEGIEADLADSAVPEAVVAEVVARAGRLDVLVNNAGIMQEARAEDMSLADWERTIRVNLTAPFLLIRAAVPHLRATHGAIVNIGSIEGLGSNPQHAAYCASKAGLHGLTRAVAVDHGAEGIRCNAVAPGWIDTDLNATLPPDVREKESAKIWMRRWARPEEMARCAAHILAMPYFMGQVLMADGGYR